MCQSSICKPSTRSNSAVLCVTRVASFAGAMDAISKSFGPMRAPRRASSAWGKALCPKIELGLADRAKHHRRKIRTYQLALDGGLAAAQELNAGVGVEEMFHASSSRVS